MAKAKDAGPAVGGVPLLVGAVCFGLVAALLAFVYLKSREAALEAKYRDEDERVVRVIVANRDLPRGAQIRSGDFAQRSVPAKFVHDDAITSVSEFEGYVGQALTANVGRGRPLLKSFIDREFPVDFSDSIPVERRAITVQVDEVNSIAGFIRPGNRIDVFVNVPFKTSGFDARLFTTGLLQELPPDVRTILPPVLVDALEAGQNIDPDTLDELVASTSPKDVIMPVLQNVRVLATGRDPYRENLDELRYPQNRTERTFSTLTLDVTPREGALLAAAEDAGDLLAMLRNRDDPSTADFTGVAPEDLFSHAVGMAQEEANRKARVAAAAGTDVNGNLVDADGNTIMSAEALAAAGYTVDENGNIVDENGNIVDPSDLVVTADGKILSKSALEAAGYTVDENGQVIDANGNVVDASKLVVTSDGTVLNADELAAAGLTLNENGEIVDANGRVYDPDELVKTADGKIFTKDQLKSAGLSVNENGEVVDANGNVVDTSGLRVGDAAVVTADGKVLNRAALEAAGLSVNENGEIVDANGNVVDPDDLVMAGGKVMTKDQLAAAGLSVDADGNIVDANGRIVDPASVQIGADGQVVLGPRAIDLIIGGDSTDGVAKSVPLEIGE